MKRINLYSLRRAGPFWTRGSVDITGFIRDLIKNTPILEAKLTIIKSADPLKLPASEYSFESVSSLCFI